MTVACSVLLFSSCKKCDETPPTIEIGSVLPDTLIFTTSIVGDSTYIIRRDEQGVNDTIADTNTSIVQTLSNSMTYQERRERAFNSIILLPGGQEAKFIAPNDNFFFGQDETFSYIIDGNEYTFIRSSDNSMIKGYLSTDKTQFTISFYGLRKEGNSTNATAHYPVDYETYFTTSFFPDDILVYITYDVIYELK